MRGQPLLWMPPKIKNCVREYSRARFAHRNPHSGTRKAEPGKRKVSEFPSRDDEVDQFARHDHHFPYGFAAEMFLNPRALPRRMLHLRRRRLFFHPDAVAHFSI